LIDLVDFAAIINDTWAQREISTGILRIPVPTRAIVSLLGRQRNKYHP
jgi:hypothetical protein